MTLAIEIIAFIALISVATAVPLALAYGIGRLQDRWEASSDNRPDRTVG